MAISNIFNEPRREITETLLGTVIVGLIAAPLIAGDYLLAVWFEGLVGRAELPWQAGMLVLPPLAILCALGLALSVCTAAVGVHAAGERACAALEERGIRLRPRR